MNTTAEIYLWGTRVGIIHQDLDKPYASFEYDLLEVGEKMGLKRNMRCWRMVLGANEKLK